jgi:hypothetical protein
MIMWDGGFDSHYGLVWRVSQRSTKVEGFLRVLQFPPIGKVDRVGYDKGRVFCLIVNQIIWQHVLCKAT